MCNIAEVAIECGCSTERSEQERNIANYIECCKKNNTGLSVCSQSDWEKENAEMAQIDTYWLNGQVEAQLA